MSQNDILELVRKSPGITRTKLKERLGLAKTTIHYQTNHLRRHGLVKFGTGKNKNEMVLYPK